MDFLCGFYNNFTRKIKFFLRKLKQYIRVVMVKLNG